LSLSDRARTLLVASGKGGVGKSTISIGTALALQRGGRRVGLLDLDIRAPNITYLLGIPDQCEAGPDGVPRPPVARGMPVFSPAMLFRSGGSILMGGNALRSLVLDLFNVVAWPDLDWLVVDMDPAPGDSLRAVREARGDVTGVVVTTPDRTSTEDARRMLDSFEGLGIHTAGVVGNMVGLKCHRCGEVIINGGDTREMESTAADHRTRVLAMLPWDAQIHTDPVAAAATRFAESFDWVARAVA
jgi:ATP-binding protein involved in chromosome partitioning